MAFDSNPSAVYHGTGFGELREIGAPVYDIDTDARYAEPSSGAVALTRITESLDASSQMVESPNRLVGVRVTGGDAGTDGELRFIRAGDIPEAAVTTGGSGVAASASNGLFLRIGSQSLFIASNAAGNVVVASADESALGGASFVVRFYEIR